MWPVALFMMDQRKEQRVCIKFCANLGKRAMETLTMIQQTFGDQNLSHAQMFQWHAWFKTGCTSVDDDEHKGRPTSCTTHETVARIQELVRQDRRQIIHNIAKEVRIGYGTCHRVLTEELGMHRVTAKFVPRILTADQKQQRVNVCTEIRRSPPTMKRSCLGSSLVMRAGFTVTTLRQSDNPPSGKSPFHQGQKRPDRWKAISRAWYHFLWHQGDCA